MFSQTIKLAVKSISSMLQGMGVTLHPLVIEWVTHYFTGNGEDKILPLEASEETKVAVINYLVTPKDKELLEKTAEDKSKTVSEVLRELIKTLEETN